MSQNQSNSKIPSSDELEHFKKPELKAFLKALGVGSTGNKDVLLKMAKIYANHPVVTVPSDNTSSQPNDSVLVWQNAATETAPIPSVILASVHVNSAPHFMNRQCSDVTAMTSQQCLQCLPTGSRNTVYLESAGRIEGQERGKTKPCQLLQGGSK